MKKQAYYTIGELSDICGISKRNLRFYDEKGLLIPSKRDQNNNYRYYSEEKAIEAIKVKELKKKGLSIADIKLLNQKRDLATFHNALSQIITSLNEKKRVLEEQIQQTQATYETVSQSLSLLENTNGHPHEITIDYYPKTHIYYTKYRSKHLANDLFWDRFAELTQLCEEDNVHITGSFSAIFHGHYLDQFSYDYGELEVFYPIAPLTASHPSVRVIEKQLVLSKIAIGNYRSLLSTYIDLVKFAEEQNLAIIGPSFEEYLCDFSFGVDEQKCVTRVYFPVEVKTISISSGTQKHTRELANIT